MPGRDARRDSLLDRIYGINAETFDTVALEVWQYQYEGNVLYQQFCNALDHSPDRVKTIDDIPFLPISMFRDHAIKTGEWNSITAFKSSGTTGTVPSQHFIRDLDWYHKMSTLGFTTILSAPDQYTWIGLLPSYLERPDSSLVDMVHHFMHSGANTNGGFFSEPGQQLIELLNRYAQQQSPVILIGVSFALLDLFEQYQVPVWSNLIVLETGGMKGRRAELTRDELHERFRNRHPELQIGSEYGMTELMSQAYKLDGHFMPGPTMKVCFRDISDPLCMLGEGQRGALNVIDLGNVDTCSFIATDDIGVGYGDGSFEVLGRLDQSEMRGCNLMYG